MHETHADKQQHQQRQKHFGHDFNWTVGGTNQQNVQAFVLVKGRPAWKNSPKTHIYLCAQLIIFARTPPLIYLIWSGHNSDPCAMGRANEYSPFPLTCIILSQTTTTSEQQIMTCVWTLYKHMPCVCVSVCSVKVYYAINKFVHA